MGTTKKGANCAPNDNMDVGLGSRHGQHSREEQVRFLPHPPAHEGSFLKCEGSRPDAAGDKLPRLLPSESGQVKILQAPDAPERIRGKIKREVCSMAITCTSYVTVGGKTVCFDELTEEQKHLAAQELLVRYFNALFAGEAKFYIREKEG